MGRHIVWTDRARLQDRQPTLPTREATEDDGVLFGIEVCIEVVAGLGWRERSRHRQASLGIKGHDHGGIIPPRPPARQFRARSSILLHQATMPTLVFWSRRGEA